MNQIQTITTDNKNYPESLKKIEASPKVLHFKGQITPTKNCFAIVGTRRCSSYGKQIAFQIAKELAQSGFIIVSGLASGIDTYAHLGALDADKRTIAVLGTGLDEKYIYPQENIKLAQKIVENNGCLISEYPPETHGTKFTFPQRNRIISGLSLGVLVIEAKQKSGALITASWTKKQNKKIFAIPGSINSLNSKGCHQLIKQGAVLVESADDILKELDFKKQKLDINKEIHLNTKQEILIIQVLQQGPLYIDEIIKQTALSSTQVFSVLTILENENKIKNLGANTFSLV